MRIIWDNKVMEATVTAYSSNPDYPASNIQDMRLSRLWKSLETSGGVDEYIQIDIGGDLTANYLSVVNHNFPSTATLTLKGCNADSNGAFDWSNPDQSISIPWREYLICQYFAVQTCERWRLYISVGGGLELEIGYMFLGQYLQMPYMKPDQEIEYETTSKQSVSDGGQVYGDIGYDFRNPTINFPYLTTAQKEEIIDMFAEVKNSQPIMLMIWANDFTTEPPLYCVIDQPSIKFKRTDDYNMPWSTTIRFREIF